MIINLYVIDAGICIYSFDYKKNIYVDENLLSGFLTAIGTFAQETFQTGLQAIQIRNGQKLIFFVEQTEKLIFCAVADDRDNNFLLEKILSELATKFTKKMAKTLKSSNRNRVDDYRIFDPYVKEIVKEKVKARNRTSKLKGIIIGFFTLMGLYISSSILLAMSGIPMTNVGLVILYFILSSAVELSISSLISGYFAGSPKSGLRNGILFFVILFLFIALTESGDILSLFILIFPFAIITCAASGYYGGLLRDRKKLYPLEK